MPEHLFPESTTYVGSYKPPNVDYKRKVHFSSQENSPFEYQLEEFQKRGSHTEMQLPPPSPSPSTRFCQPDGDATVKEVVAYPTSSSGAVEIKLLPPEKREFFLSKMYRTTYDDYNYAAPPVVNKCQPFSPLDDKMLKSLNASKPDLAHYGFGLPNKCCVAWSTVQCRTLPDENRKYGSERKTFVNPFPGYPEKMYPLIENRQISPHYDGSFNFGYCGYEQQCLNYPDDVNELMRKDFPQHIPRNLTTNEAKLMYQNVPACQNWPSIEGSKNPK